jgi:site-specific DNA recombinase
MGNVTVIPATKQKHGRLPGNGRKRRKVAGYARVSTDSEEQLTSYEAQVDYYTGYIRSNADWEFAGVYTDEGISALSTKHREGFNKMIDDALAGKIDLIITKSVSRFARNTVDSLSTIRKLKENGVEVYFEKEAIWSFDGKGELLLTIMSSLAQEESRSISDNVTWGQRKRFADGKVSIAFSQFLGYRRGQDGQPEIVPEEAETVRTIYRMFINGKTANYIAKHLTKKGIPTPGGKEVWQSTTVESILKNEKYKGDAILQKKFTVDFLNKKMKVNEGEVPQYYVTDSHPAIINKTEWGLAQAEMAKRKTKGKHHNSLSPFSAKIICGDCGEYFGSKVWHSTDKNKRTIWQCNGKYKGEEKCRTTHLSEDAIKELFMRATAHLLTDRDALIEDCKVMRDTLADTSSIDEECKRLTDEMDSLSMLIQKLIAENASVAMSQEEYNEKYDGYAERFNRAQEQYDKLQQRKSTLAFEVDIIECFMAEILNLPGLPMEFSDSLWNSMIDKVTMHADGRAVFTFKNGSEITEEY